MEAYAKVTGVGVTDFNINDPEYESRIFAFGASGDPYAILQEAYKYVDLNNKPRIESLRLISGYKF